MTKKEEIQFLLKSQSIKLGSLAEKIGMNPQTLNFLINDTHELDEELYKKIIEQLEAFQLELGIIDYSSDNYDLFNDRELNESIGERIRLFAKRKFGTSKKLSESMNISPQQLQQYISGNREPGSRILFKLFELGCDINWLLSGSEKVESYRIYKLEQQIKKLNEKIIKIRNLTLNNGTNDEE